MDVDGDSKLAFNFFTDRTLDYGVSMYLPAYIPYDAVTKQPVSWSAVAATNRFRVFIHYKFEDGNQNLVVEVPNIANDARCTAVINYALTTGQPVDAMTLGTGEGYCVTHNNRTENRPVISVKAHNGADPLKQWKYAGIVIAFEPLEIMKGTKITSPGSSYYYLTKLGRLELVGIPQITYEPLYCSNNHNRLVPGIFKPAVTTRGQFQLASQSLQHSTMDPSAMYGGAINADSNGGFGNGGKHYTYQDKLDIAPIFSSKDFTCCTPLGKETTAAGKCCSGFAVPAGTAGVAATKQICKLPTGTDLNVYFNKFVSSDGVGITQPGGEGLIADDIDEEKIDFIAHTGEPKLRDATMAKIQLLGEAYCQNSLVTLGGAFGNFPPEPFAGTYNTPPDGIPNGGSLASTFPLSIVDSIVDFERDKPERGKFPFDNGLRWNHHFYCK